MIRSNYFFFPAARCCRAASVSQEKMFKNLINILLIFQSLSN